MLIDVWLWSGQSGAVWAHYVGRNKLRPQDTAWQPLAFCLDWQSPASADERLHLLLRPLWPVAFRETGCERILSPLADKTKFRCSLIDYTYEPKDGLVAVCTAVQPVNSAGHVPAEAENRWYGTCPGR